MLGVFVHNHRFTLRTHNISTMPCLLSIQCYTGDNSSPRCTHSSCLLSFALTSFHWLVPSLLHEKLCSSYVLCMVHSTSNTMQRKQSTTSPHSKWISSITFEAFNAVPALQSSSSEASSSQSLLLCWSGIKHKNLMFHVVNGCALLLHVLYTSVNPW